MQQSPPGHVYLVDVPETRLAVLEHRGDPKRIGESVRRFIEWRKQNGLPPHRSATFNILYDDPERVAPEAFRLDLGAAIERDIPENSRDIVERTIPAGRCAVLRHIGTDAGLGTSLRYLCTEWLAQSGETRRDFPVFLQRVRFGPEVAETEAITDLYLPLE